MRKITSKKIESKKEKIKQIVVGSLLVFIMILSTVGFSLNNTGENKQEKIIYNNIEFLREENLWNAKIGNFNFIFEYNPKETEKINEELNYADRYINLPLYIYSENPDATTEIYKNLFYYNRIVERVQEACPVGETCDPEIPVKNCSNNFIIIKKSGENIITQEENCVFISGEERELVKMTDSFLFNILGIQ
jgi:hypothetical protein